MEGHPKKLILSTERDVVLLRGEVIWEVLVKDLLISKLGKGTTCHASSVEDELQRLTREMSRRKRRNLKERGGVKSFRKA